MTLEESRKAARQAFIVFKDERDYQNSIRTASLVVTKQDEDKLYDMYTDYVTARNNCDFMRKQLAKA